MKKYVLKNIEKINFVFITSLGLVAFFYMCLGMYQEAIIMTLLYSITSITQEMRAIKKSLDYTWYSIHKLDKKDGD